MSIKYLALIAMLVWGVTACEPDDEAATENSAVENTGAVTESSAGSTVENLGGSTEDLTAGMTADMTAGMTAGNSTEINGGESTGEQRISGFADAESLSMSYSQLGVAAQEVAVGYCNLCAESQFCGETLFDTTTTLENARCIMENSSEEQLAALAQMITCESESVSAMMSCAQMIMMCNDELFSECLYLYGAECEYDYSYIAQTDHACFDGPAPFTCTGGEVIPNYWYCDGFPDCQDESDEPSDCPPPFVCADGLELAGTWRCDGEADCDGGEDEVDCPEGD